MKSYFMQSAQPSYGLVGTFAFGWVLYSVMFYSWVSLLEDARTVDSATVAGASVAVAMMAYPICMMTIARLHGFADQGPRQHLDSGR